MICALIIGRAGSKGFKNKNLKEVLGKKICEYPILAAKNSKNARKTYPLEDNKFLLIEDELFLVFKGTLFIDFRDDKTVEVNEGEIIIIPMGVEHRPRTNGDVVFNGSKPHAI